VDGARLELRSTTELCRNDKLVAEEHLCALMLAYVEKEPASFGAAFNCKRERYNQGRGCKRPRQEQSVTKAPAINFLRLKTTQNLPGVQFVGTVESGKFPQTEAAEIQADPTFDRHFTSSGAMATSVLLQK
jgi:hypothetical protein